MFKCNPTSNNINQSNRITQNISKMAKVQISESQVPHFNKCMEILSKFPYYFDTSVMGTGKTIIATALAQACGVPLFVLSPKGCRNVWIAETAKYGVVLLEVMSYGSLVSTKGSTPKHGLTVRKEGANGKPTFFLTDNFKQIIANGALFVFDECQALRNKNQANAVTTLIVAEILKGVGARSRFALLSGTPVTKEKNCITLMHVLQIISDNHKIWTTGEKNAVQDVVKFCRSQNPQMADAFLLTNKTPTNGSTANKFCYNIFAKCVMPMISSAMPKINNGFKLDVKNGFYKMSEACNKELTNALMILKGEIEDPVTGMKKKQAFGFEDKLSAIDFAKREIYAEEALKVLQGSATAKVLVFCDHIKPLEYVQKYLTEKGYAVLKITGETAEETRNLYISTFQTDPRYRVFIGTTKTCGTGISLHDTNGNFPRTMFVTPSFHAMTIAQAASRIYRFSNASDATVRLVYGNAGDVETRVKNILNDRSVVMKDTLPLQVEHGVEFPIDYDDEYHYTR